MSTAEGRMVEQSHADWVAEGTRRFGEPRNWRFVCPACANVQTAQDFKDIGADPAKAYCECIGRHLPREQTRSGLEGEGPGPCDWAAYGLFGTLGKGRRIVRDSDEAVEVFDFAGAE